MANLGYHWTWQQLRNCWKNLKKRFTAERLEQERSGAAPSAWKWYDHMSALLSHRPMMQAREYGVDSQDVPPDYGDNSQLDISDADTRTEEDNADILQEQSERKLGQFLSTRWHLIARLQNKIGSLGPCSHFDFSWY
ncbi:uncharacterized protein LOC144124627 [Amblyomma americanum]